ncbi:MAG: leucine-rich repeat protein [Clostridiales bacterium]|nr:leucine-rich repeat protein [Clostridiales bacterium]
MKRLTKAVLSVVMSAVLAVGAFCTLPAVKAEEVSPRGDVYAANLSKDIVYSYNTQNRKMTISGHGEMPAYEPPEGDFSNCVWKDVITVEIGEGITSVGDKMFYLCDKIEEVRLPDTLSVIGKSAFSGCSSMTDIDIPQSVKCIYDTAFEGCSSMHEFILPQGLSYLGGAVFRGCTSLMNIDIPSGTVSDGYRLFDGCTSLTELIVPTTCKVGQSFAYNCSELKLVDIGYGSKSIGAFAFSGCTKLRDIKIPRTVTNIASNAFYEMENYFGNSAYAPKINIYSEPQSYVEDFVNNYAYNIFIFKNALFDSPYTRNITLSYYDFNREQVVKTKVIGYSEKAPMYNPPVVDDYSFFGWYDNLYCVGGPIDFSAQRFYDDTSLYPKYVSNNKYAFNFNTDIFSFANQGNNDRLRGEYYNHLVYDKANLFQRIAHRKAFKNNAEGGICYGMSSIMILSKLNKIDLSYYNKSCLAEIADPSMDTGKGNPTNLNYIDWNTSQLTLFYQKSQFTGDLSKYRWNYSEHNEHRNIRNIVSYAEGTDKPFILSLYVNGDDHDTGHAIVVYKTKSESNGDFTMYCCDPNHATPRDKIVISADRSYADFYWYDPDSGSYYRCDNYKNMFLKCAVPVNLLYSYDITGHLKDKNIYYRPNHGGEETDELYEQIYNDSYSQTYVTVNYPNFTVVTSSGKTAEIRDNTYYSGDSDLIEYLGPADDEEDCDRGTFRIPELSNGETVTVTPVNNTGISEYYTMYEDNSCEENGGGAYVESPAPVSVIFSENGKVETNYIASVYQTVCTVNNSNTSNCGATEFTANTKGLKVTPQQNNLTVETKDYTTVSVNVLYDDEFVTKEVSVGANDVVTISQANTKTVNINKNGAAFDSMILPFTVKFESYVSSGCERQTGLSNGDKLTVPDAVKPGYTAKWYRNPEFTGNPWDFANDTVNSDITLYAKWTPDSSAFCKLKYYSDDILYTDDDVVIGLSGVQLAPAPQKDEYMFTGWYLDESLTIPVSYSTAFFVDTKLYAGWKKIGKVNIEAEDVDACFGNNGKYDSFGLAGIQIKILENDTDEYGNGLRFCLTLEKQLYNDLVYLYGDNITFGNAVALKSRLSGVENMTLETPGVVNSESKNIFYDGTAYQVATTLIHHIPKENYATDITARPYVRYIDRNGNEQIYYYTESDSQNVIAKGYYTSLKTAAQYICDNDIGSYSQSAVEYLQSIINS